MTDHPCQNLLLYCNVKKKKPKSVQKELMDLDVFSAEFEKMESGLRHHLDLFFFFSFLAGLPVISYRRAISNLLTMVSHMFLIFYELISQSYYILYKNQKKKNFENQNIQ